MRRSTRRFLLLTLSLGLIHHADIAQADRGGLPFLPNAVLSVPRQQAILGWNGSEEVLILGTDRRASQDVKVLEVLPLPAEPTIWKPKEEVFDTARAMIAQKTNKARSTIGMGYAGAPKSSPAGEVTKHRKIGTHDIRVVHVKDPYEFIRWAQDNLKKWGAQAQDLPAPFRRVVSQYIADGYRWFAFDIVELGPDVGSLEPVGYRFASDYLYFPLRVTTLDHGNSTVDLMILTDQQITKPATVGHANVSGHGRVELSAADQRKIDGHLAGTFPGRGAAWIETWQLSAKTSAFTQDLRVR